MSFNINDYVDVKQRINMFYSLYPDGSLQFHFKGTLDHDEEMIWGIAYAYRHPGDTQPATGHAQELAKGKTNFTRGSELQNLETSAIGRAIGMLGIGIDTALASADEVEAAQERQRPNPITKVPKQSKSYAKEPATEAQRKLIQKLMPGPAWVEDWKAQHGITGAINKVEASAIIEELQALPKKPHMSQTDYPRITDGD